MTEAQRQLLSALADRSDGRAVVESAAWETVAGLVMTLPPLIEAYEMMSESFVCRITPAGRAALAAEDGPK